MKDAASQTQIGTEARLSSLLKELDRPMSAEDIERALARVKQKAAARRPLRAVSR